MMMPLLVALKGHVDKLAGLLNDPQPGLMTWATFVGEHWKAVAELWTNGLPKEGERRPPARPVFEFDDRSLLSLEELKARGYSFVRVEAGGRVILVPDQSAAPSERAQ